MSKRFFVILTLIFLSTVSIYAQKNSVSANKIKLGDKTISIKGKIFNEVIYNFDSNQTKYVAYQFIDQIKKTLVITEISFDIENNKAIATQIEIYTCPLNRIDKQNSYNLEMENDAIKGGKYLRLTLVSTGQGADNLYFEKQKITAETTEKTAVNNVTINIINKIDAEKWLKIFTK